MDGKYISSSRNDWLKFRKKIIGGSDVGAILGFNQHRTALDVYFDKIDLEYAQADTYEMKVGRRLEKTVAEWWEDETGLKCIPDIDDNGNIIVRIHPQYPFLGATLDRIILPHDDLDFGILEIKTGKESVESWDQGPPLSYWAQIQHQLSVTGYNYGQFAVLLAGINGFIFKILPVERDDEFIELMNRELVHFWSDHVMKNEPPEPVVAEDVEKLYPQAKPGAVEVNDAVYQTYLQLVQIRNEIEELNKEKMKFESQLKMLIGEHQEIRYSGKILATWKNIKNFDEERFAQENPKIYRKYCNIFNLSLFKEENPDIYNQFIGLGPRRFIIH